MRDPDAPATDDELIEERDALRQRIEELERALDKLVWLQAHYAKLLNMHDGGERREFKSAEEWLEQAVRSEE